MALIRDPSTGNLIDTTTNTIVSKGSPAPIQKTTSKTAIEKEQESLLNIADKGGLGDQALDKVKSGGLNVLKGIGRVLNFGAAATSGILEGAVDPKISMFEGFKRNVAENRSFTDIFAEESAKHKKQLEAMGKPQPLQQKAFYGTTGLAADIFLDPLTYVTFGVSGGLKFAGKMLTKGGKTIVKEGIEDIVAKQVAKGATQDIAMRVGRETLEDVVKTISTKGKLDSTDLARLAESGLDSSILDDISKLGSDLIDTRKGIFFAGKQIPATDLAATRITRSIDAFKGTPFFKSIDESVGKAFGTDLAKDQLAQKLIKEDSFSVFQQTKDLQFDIRAAEKLIGKNINDFLDAVLPFNLQVRQAAQSGLDDFNAEFGTEITEQIARQIAKNPDEFVEILIPALAKKDITTFTKVEKEKLIRLAEERGVTGKSMLEIQDALRKNLTKNSDAILRRQKVALQRVGTARRRAKAEINKASLIFKTGDAALDAKLGQAADILFGGGNDGRAAVVTRMAAMGGISKEEAIKFYIPFEYKDKLNQSKAILRNFSKINKDFQKLSTAKDIDHLIKDPIGGLMRQTVNVAVGRAKTNAAVTLTQKAGRHFNSPEQAAENGYKLFKFDGLDNKISGYIKEEYHEAITKFVAPEFTTVDKLAKITGFDYMTDLFKGWVTSPFLGFHFRNFVSNQFLNVLENGLGILRPKNQMDAIRVQTAMKKIGQGKNRYADPVFKQTIKTVFGEVTIKQIIEDIGKKGILGQGAFGISLDDGLNAGKFAGGIIPPKLRTSFRYNPASKDFVLIKLGRQFGGAIEDQSKLVSYIGNIRRGLDADEAWGATERALFDYSNMTEFERKILRRFIPFYTFQKKNVELQFRTLMRTPGRTANQLKLFKGAEAAIGEPISGEEEEGLAPWVKNQLGIKLGQTDEFDRNYYVTGFGHPIEAVTDFLSGNDNIFINMVNNSLSMMNPVLKFPAERALGRDFFREKDLVDITNADDFAMILDALPDGIEKDIKELIEWNESTRSIYVNGVETGTEPKYEANPLYLHFFRNLFTSRLTSTISKAGDSTQDPFLKIINLTTGVKVNVIDTERQKFFNTVEENERLSNFMDRMNLIKKYDRFFEVEED